MILFDETRRQSASDGTPLPDVLRARGILPGMKVDKSTHPLAGFPGEKVTEGLGGLRDWLAEYRDLGAAFAKWRAVITIGSGLPSQTCIAANAEVLARYAALCQEAGLVPIVEPEVLMDGDRDIGRCFDATLTTLQRVYQALAEHRVALQHSLLKPNMPVSGKEAAEQTLRCLYESVPAAVPGIAFLSGGQSPAGATAHLDAMNRRGPHPWQLTFSFARALQGPALEAWKGDAARAAAAQQALAHRARCAAAARRGAYSAELERAA